MEYFLCIFADYHSTILQNIKLSKLFDTNDNHIFV